MDAKSSRLTRSTGFIDDVTELHDHIQRLRALLDLQRRQVGVIEARLYPAGPAGTAARRLTALKNAGRF
jgi:hypothetical protein